MKTLLIASLFAILAITFACEDSLDKNLDTDWKIWKATHKKVYYTLIEENFRRLIWEDNLLYIQEMNSRGLSYTLGTNEFTDMTSKEFNEIMNGYKQELRNDKHENEVKNYSSIKLSERVDWRQKGAVTPVKNQGQCGSCWAFSATGSLEGQNFRRNGKLESFSESQLVDCSRSYGNNGCKGGLMDNAFRYWEVYKAELESDYPYDPKDGTCKYNQNLGVTTISSYRNVPHSLRSLQSAIADIGPISVAMDAGHRSFQQYHSGVYSEPACSQTKLDHGVLAIGYDTSSSVPYWLVKNSWGPSWGMEGYFEITMEGNMCGLETEASYPIL